MLYSKENGSSRLCIVKDKKKREKRIPEERDLNEVCGPPHIGRVY